MWFKLALWTWLLLLQCSSSMANILEDNCPLSCSCQKAPFKELAISRWIREIDLTTTSEDHQDEDNVEENDASGYDIDEDYQHLPLVGSVTCVLGSQNIEQLLRQLPHDTQALTLIQPTTTSEINDTTIRSSWLRNLPDLRALQVQGGDRILTFHTDEPLEDLLYLRLEGSRLLGTGFSGPLIDTPSEDPKRGSEYTPTLTYGFEEPEEEIVPYEEYIKTQRERRKNDDPLITFYGWSSLQVLNIHDCSLLDVQRDMFNGLERLRRLSLERNGLRFIPDHAFHGCPQLRSLSLAKNDILNLFYRGLAGLTKLRRLDLSYNNLTRLSERTFAPFPNLREVDIRESPIKELFPNTFGVMNSTRFLALGSAEQALELAGGSFANLGLLETLLVMNAQVQELTNDIFIGLDNLISLTMTGDLKSIQFDAFANSPKLSELVLNRCKIQTISMDAFVGVPRLTKLDLSNNVLRELQPGVFDPLTTIKELYLQDNFLKDIPKATFMKIKPKLVRLLNNPWHCTCAMSDWNPMSTNKAKRLAKRKCRFMPDDGFKCDPETLDYIYDNKMAPRCETPLRYKNLNVYHALRKQTHCWGNTAKDIRKTNKKKYLKNKHKLLPISHNSSADVQVVQEANKNLINGSDFRRKQIVPYLQDEINDLSPFNNDPVINQAPALIKVSKAQKLYNTKLQRLARFDQKYHKVKKIEMDL